MVKNKNATLIISAVNNGSGKVRLVKPKNIIQMYNYQPRINFHIVS